jgi:WD40 repeat protein
VDLAAALTDQAEHARMTGNLDAADAFASEAASISSSGQMVPAQSAALAARARICASRAGAAPEPECLQQGRDAADAALKLAAPRWLAWHALDALDAHAALDIAEGADRGWAAKADALRVRLIPPGLDADPLRLLERQAGSGGSAEAPSLGTQTPRAPYLGPLEDIGACVPPFGLSEDGEILVPASPAEGPPGHDFSRESTAIIAELLGRSEGLLTALAYARGPGVGDHRWLDFAGALGFENVTGETIASLRATSAAELVLETQEEHGQLVTRLSSRAPAATVLRGRDRQRDERQILRLLRAEAARDGWSASSRYARDHAPEHAAAAGLLEELVHEADFLAAVTPAGMGAVISAMPAEDRSHPAAIYTAALPFLGDQAGDNAAILAFVSTVQGNQVLARALNEVNVPRQYAVTGHVRPFSPPLACTDRHDGPVMGAAVLDWPGLDRQVVVTTSADGTARVWDPLDPAGELARFTSHSSDVMGAAVLDWPGLDHQVVVTTSADKTARVWDPLDPAGELARLSGHDGLVMGAAVLDWPGLDHQVVVTTSADKTARVWDPLDPAGELARFTAHSAEVMGAAALDWPGLDHPLLVTTSADRTARVWDPASADRELARFDGHTEIVSAAAALDWPGLDHPVVVTTSADRTARVWDPASADRELARFDAHASLSAVAAMAWDGVDHRVVVTTAVDKTARVWDPCPSGKQLAQFTHHEDRLWSLATLAWPGLDHQAVVTTSYDGTARVWDPAVPDQELARFTGHSGVVSGAAALTWPGLDHPVVATTSGDGTARVWDPSDPGRELACFGGHTGPVMGVAALGWPGLDHPVIVTVSADATARVWDPSDPGRELACFGGHTGPVMGVAALGWPGLDHQVVVTASDDGTARVWDPAAPDRELARFDGHARGLMGVAVLDWPGLDHPVVATASKDGTARVWDPAAQARELACFGGHTRAVAGVSALTWPGLDRPLLLTGSADGTARIWDHHQPHRELARFDGHTDIVMGVAVLDWPGLAHPVVATASLDATARIWSPDLARGLYTGHADDVVGAAALDWPGLGHQVLVTGSADATARIWDPTSPYRELARFTGHTQGVAGVAALDWPGLDHHVVVSTSFDTTARVWDPMQPGRELARFTGHEQGVVAAAPLEWPGLAHRVVITASYDGTARVWDPQDPERELARFTGHTGLVSGVAVLDWPGLDHQAVVSTSFDTTARVWDPARPSRELARFTGHELPVMSAAALDWPGLDHPVIVTSSLDRTARIWDPHDPQHELASFTGHVGPVIAAAPVDWPGLEHPVVATTSLDGTARVWDPRNPGRELARWPLFSEGFAVTHLIGGAAAATTAGGFLIFEPKAHEEPGAESVLATLRLMHEAEGTAHVVRMTLEGKSTRQAAEARFGFQLTAQEREDIRWYLEDYLLYPVDPGPLIAQRIERRLAALGTELFTAVFRANGDTAGLWAAASDALANTRVEVVSDREGSTAIPWELLRDPDDGNVVSLRAASFIRAHGEESGLSVAGAGGTLRVLLVICRPAGRADIPFRSVANRLVRLGEQDGRAIRLEVLRPPTFRQLATTLAAAKAAGTPYHIVHFDGHGTYLDTAAAVDGEPADPPERRAGRGYLIFEGEPGNPNQRLVEGSSLGGLLAECGVQVLVLNACRSAHADPAPEPASAGGEPETGHPAQAYGSLAQEVMDAGVTGVLAMRYNVYVVTAAAFIGDVYAAILAGQSLGAAVSGARRKLADNPQRQIVAKPRDLQDWLVPVAYEAAPFAFRRVPVGTAAAAGPDQAGTGAGRELLDPALPPRPEPGFVGRDETLLALDRAFDRNPVVLLHGPAAAGKTSAAAEFARWYALTGGVGQVLFTQFTDHISLASLLEQAVRATWPAAAEGLEDVHAPGTEALKHLSSAERRDVALHALTRMPVLWVWDGVQQAAADPADVTDEWTTAQRHELAGLLGDLSRYTQAKVLLTSRRSEQDWLAGLPLRLEIPGMPTVERLELARAVAGQFLGSAPQFLDAEDWRPLLDFSQGNPLAITFLVRQALQEGRTTAELIRTFADELRTGAARISSGAPDDRDASLTASIDYGFDRAFTAVEQAQLALLALFQGVADVDSMRWMGDPAIMAGPVPAAIGLTRTAAAALLDRAVEAGLLAPLAQGYYTIQPAASSLFQALFERHHGRQGHPAAATAVHAWTTAISELTTVYVGMHEAGQAWVPAVLSIEEPNLTRAVHVARAHGWWRLAVEVMQGLTILYRQTGRTAEWRQLVNELTPGKAGTPANEPQPDSETHRAIDEYRIDIAEEDRDWPAAERLLRKAVTRRRAETRDFLTAAPESLEDSQRLQIRNLASRLMHLGWALQELANPELLEVYLEAADLYRRIGAEREAANVALQLGLAYTKPPLRNLDEAERWYQSAVDSLGEDDLLARSATATQLGAVAYQRYLDAQAAGAPDQQLAGYLGQAKSAYQHALVLTPAWATAALGGAHNQLGTVLDHDGDLADALRHYQMAIQYEERSGDRYAAGKTRFNAALALARRSRLADALLFARAALDDLEAAGPNAASEADYTRHLIVRIEQAERETADEHGDGRH